MSNFFYSSIGSLSALVPDGFSPNNYTLGGWWDFSDASKVIEVGGKVSEIRDKSSNEYHLTQNTDSKRPIYTIGSHATFDRANSTILSRTQEVSWGQSPWSLFIVASADAFNSSNYPEMFSVRTGSRTLSLKLHRWANEFGGANSDTSTINPSSRSTYLPGRKSIFRVTFDGASNVLSEYNQEDIVTDITSVVWAGSASVLAIGGSATTGRFAGDIYEVILYLGQDEATALAFRNWLALKHEVSFEALRALNILGGAYGSTEENVLFFNTSHTLYRPNVDAYDLAGVPFTPFYLSCDSASCRVPVRIEDPALKGVDIENLDIRYKTEIMPLSASWSMCHSSFNSDLRNLGMRHPGHYPAMALYTERITVKNAYVFNCSDGLRYVRDDDVSSSPASTDTIIKNSWFEYVRDDFVESEYTEGNLKIEECLIDGAYAGISTNSANAGTYPNKRGINYITITNTGIRLEPQPWPFKWYEPYRYEDPITEVAEFDYFPESDLANIETPFLPSRVSANGIPFHHGDLFKLDPILDRNHSFILRDNVFYITKLARFVDFPPHELLHECVNNIIIYGGDRFSTDAEFEAAMNQIPSSYPDSIGPKYPTSGLTFSIDKSIWKNFVVQWHSQNTTSGPVVANTDDRILTPYPRFHLIPTLTSVTYPDSGSGLPSTLGADTEVTINFSLTNEHSNTVNISQSVELLLEDAEISATILTQPTLPSSLNSGEVVSSSVVLSLSSVNDDNSDEETSVRILFTYTNKNGRVVKEPLIIYMPII